MTGTRTVIVTGGMGFIGSNLILWLRQHRPSWRIVNVDALTYAGHPANLASLAGDPLHVFARVDITDREAVRAVFEAHRPDGVFHLAAESHVDRSIVEPLAFVRTNVEGTVVLLQEAARAWKEHSPHSPRFLHVSTDEVFGELGEDERFCEQTPYAPRSPYAASKAAADHMVRAWANTFGLPAIITNCTNNYGPRQFPEKLIPVVVTRAVEGQPVPVYGRGENVRDWLFVDDHCDALLTVFERGEPGRTYAIGGEREVRNLELVTRVLDEVDRQLGRPEGTSRALVRFVTDRPGHDYRYAMDIGRIRAELGWSPATSFEEGLARTVAWYLGAQEWLAAIGSADHETFQSRWYGRRLDSTGGGEQGEAP